MFTTIAKLRASSAQQNRVTQVNTYMKRNYPGFTDNSLIPAFMVGISNSDADQGWVESASSVLVTGFSGQPTLAQVRTAIGNARTKEDKKKAGTKLYVEAYVKANSPDGEDGKMAFFIKEAGSAAAQPTEAQVATTALPTTPVAGTTPTDTTAAQPQVAAVGKTGAVGKPGAMSGKAATGKRYAAEPATKPVAPAAKKAVAAKAPAAKAAPAAKPVVYLDNKGKNVPAAQIARIKALNDKATSKEKRAKVLDSFNIPFERLIVALAQQNLLTPNQIEAATRAL